jgi:IS30 family transposase
LYCHPQVAASRWETIERLRREGWSTEQMQGRLDDQGLPTVRPEWIVQYIVNDKSESDDLYTHLRRQKQRKACYGSIGTRGQLKN